MVDTMLVADMIHLAQRGDDKFVVVSSDDDLWPGMLSAMASGSTVIHVTTKHTSAASTYLGTMRPRYYTLAI